MSVLGTALSALKTFVQDIQHFGPSVLRRYVHGGDKAGRSEVATRFGRFTVRQSETDMKVLRQIFIQREYDLDRFPQGALVRAAYDGILRRGRLPLIVDAGANVGFAANFFARAYPKARIISIEPDPGNAAMCRTNTHGLQQVEVLEAAVGARPGCVSLEGIEGHAWGVRTRRAEAGLPVVTINQLAAGLPDSELLIVKVDIEGFELDLFSAGTEWVSQAHAVIVEPHDWLLPDARTSQTLQQVMLGHGGDLLISGENLIWIKR